MSWAEVIKETVSTGVGEALGFVGSVAADSLEKANESVVRRQAPPPEPAEDPKALMYDPFAVIDQLGYKDRPTGITYFTLAEMARRVPIFAAIVQTRITQIANFAQAEDDEREPGYQIKLRDTQKNATRAEQKRAAEIQDFVLFTGATQKLGKDTFEDFLRKIVRDSLVYDQGTFEVVPDHRGLPADFYAVDAATIRIADVPVGADVDDDPNRSRYVQIYDEVVIAEFAAREMCFGIRNPRTDIRMNGYGFGELEMLLNTITALLWGFEYNKRFFSQGSVTKGILNVKGSIPDSKLDAFRRSWYQMISGVANAWRTPVINADELQYVSMHTTNRDMEYGEWMNFLIKITCAVCQMDPAELNFVFGNTGQSSSLIQGGPAERIKASKDRGLRPMLRAIQKWINRYVIWPIEPDYQLVFTGIDPRSVDQEVDLQKKRSTFMMTVDEIRAEEDLEPLPDGKGEVILDPTWLQYAQGKEMADQQGGEEDGEEEAPDEGAGPTDWDALFGGDHEQSQSGQQPEQTEKSLPRVYDLEL